MTRGSVFHISPRFIKVWQRDLKVYQKTWKINFLPPLLEPLFYVLAFGLGLGAIVGTLSYRGMELSYVSFIAPALIAIAIMTNAFYETTYASFVRMYYQKTFDTMMATPLSLEDIITGEIVWGATKSVIATIIMSIILSFFGLIHILWGVLLIPLALLGGIAFGALGMFFTGITPTIETFNLPIFLLITPMFLFSETFFPLTSLPSWAQKVSWALPLTHLVQACRALSTGVLTFQLIFNVLYLITFCFLFVPLSIRKMHTRLIK
ncbi:MAG: ABC transporter permease [bacterium]